MTTYRNLYHGMVRSTSEAIDLYDEGKGILAREVLKKALLDAEEQIIAQDIIPDEPINSTDPAKDYPERGERSNAAPAGSLPPSFRHTRLTIVRRG